MKETFERLELLIGEENLQNLKKKTVAIFGLGGVGSYVLEGLARCGIGNFILIDADKIDVTNINRQILATTKTIGKLKVDVAEERVREINPEANVIKFAEFILGKTNDKEETESDNEENRDVFETIKKADYIIDAIDTVSSKIRIIEFAKLNNIPIISALGTGNKLNPTKLKIADIYDTKVCPLAKVMRKELRKRNILDLDVVYSEEEPIKIEEDNLSDEEKNCKKVIGSISYVPSVAGLFISYRVVENMLEGKNNNLT